MTAWRQRWYPDLAPTGGLDMGMGEMAVSTDESKPFDQRFIEATLSHHQGAIAMAQMAQHMAEHQEIKNPGRRHHHGPTSRDRSDAELASGMVCSC